MSNTDANVRSNEPELVLCIPGPWSNRSEFVRAVVEKSEGYIFAGQVLMHTESKFACELDFTQPDPRMLGAFQAAGPHWKASPEMSAIAQHKSVVYLIGKGGSRPNAKAMMLAGRGIVKAGGMGVKVESTGLAHSPKAWIEYTENLHLLAAHEALVVYVTGEEVYSCGMHNLGLRDAITVSADQIQAVKLLKVFTRYMFAESPIIKSGQTFSADTSSPIYRIHADPGIEYEEGSLFTNPYGAWRLTLAERQ